MQYTSRTGDRPAQAHVNYRCPCGCEAGLLYDRESGPEHLGRCCCGRLLWVGDGAEGIVQSHLKDGRDYEVVSGRVTLPWGEEAVTALAVPRDALEAEAAKRATGKVPTKIVDPVCRMMFDPDDAAATSVYKGVTYYFCAAACKARFDSEPGRYIRPRRRGALGRLFGLRE
jgi:YHS domain-containing protein